MIFFWIMLYGIAHFAGKSLDWRYDAADWGYAAVMLLYAVLLVLWTIRTGNYRPVRLNTVHWNGIRDFPYFLPLAVLPAYNLIAGGFCLPSGTDVLIMLSISVTEELFFRGYLLSFLREKGNASAIFITSILFALLHGANWFENADWIYVLLQMLSAFVVSICFCKITIRFRSVLPCMAAHFFINITGTGSIENSTHLFGLAVCIAIYACYGMWLSCEAKQTIKETVS